MKLELKESNSPFWVLGLDHGKITVGSFTNKPCYYKSSKKWYEFAKQIINQPRIDEVYLITGVEWDNMKGSWSAKEAGSYVQNKGKLILSKNEITTYEKKYGPVEVNEGNFPKGMSKDPLPKKGVKTYTSSATTLEGDEKMKLELKEKTNEDVYIFESNIDSEDPANAKELWDDINVVKKENGKECKIIKSSKLPGFPNEFEEMIHDIEFDDGTVINNVFGKFLTYKEPSKKVEEGATKLEKGEGDIFENAGTTWKVLAQNEEDTLIVALDSDGNERNKFVVAWGLQSDGSWNQGHYFQDKEKAKKYFEKRAKKIESLKESKIVTPVGNPQTAGSFVNIDVDLDHMEVSDFIVRLAQAIRSEQTAVLEYVALRSANGITNEDRNVIDGIMKEEKNHMAALTALLYKQILMNHKENVDEANNEFILPKFGADLFDENNKLTESISNTLDKIIAKEGVSVRMSDEYFIGNRDDGRIYHGLQQALDTIKNIISKSGEEVVIQNVTLSDENNLKEDIFNNTQELINELKTDTNYDEIAHHIHEYSKTNKKKASELMDLLFELENNKSPKECVDEIIKHLTTTEYTKQMTINKICKESMDPEGDFFVGDNETGRLYHGYRDAINAVTFLLKNTNKPVVIYANNDEEIEEENRQYKTEDTKIIPKDNKYNIEIDVEYDSDVANQIFDNIAREVEEYNKNNEINLSNLGLKDGKFYFTVNKEVDEQMVKDICDEIFDKATNYEYQIIIA